MTSIPRPAWAGWSDGTLVFGTPLVGFAWSQLSADRYELRLGGLRRGPGLWRAL